MDIKRAEAIALASRRVEESQYNVRRLKVNHEETQAAQRHAANRLAEAQSVLETESYILEALMNEKEG